MENQIYWNPVFKGVFGKRYNSSIDSNPLLTSFLKDKKIEVKKDKIKKYIILTDKNTEERYYVYYNKYLLTINSLDKEFEFDSNGLKETKYFKKSDGFICQTTYVNQDDDYFCAQTNYQFFKNDLCDYVDKKSKFGKVAIYSYPQMFLKHNLLPSAVLIILGVKQADSNEIKFEVMDGNEKKLNEYCISDNKTTISQFKDSFEQVIASFDIQRELQNLTKDDIIAVGRTKKRIKGKN